MFNGHSHHQGRTQCDMQLIDIEISSVPEALPDAVTDFLDEAQARVSRFVDEHALLPTGFVPSNFETVFRALVTICPLYPSDAADDLTRDTRGSRPSLARVD